MGHNRPQTLRQRFLYAFGRLFPLRPVNSTNGSVGMSIGDLTLEQRQQLRSLTDKSSVNALRELERIRAERGE